MSLQVASRGFCGGRGHASSWVMLFGGFVGVCRVSMSSLPFPTWILLLQLIVTELD